MSEIVKANVETGNTVKLYGSDAEIQALGTLVKQFAPWAEKLDNIQIGGVVRRVMAMGLDPLNGYEVQIWKDKRGIVQVQPAYTLMIDWVKKFKGDHTQPRYYRLVGEELEAQGLPENAIAYRCTFIMNDDLDRMTTLLNMRVYNPEEVRAMFEVSGLGVAQLNEYNGEYFAPAGRSRSWKVEKRALVDAYRHKFGTPSRAEIETLRRESGTDKIQPDDWEGAYEVGADSRGTVALAQDAAQRRDAEPITVEEARDGANALYGDGNDGVVDGVFKETTAETDVPQDDFDEATFNFEDIEEIPFNYETEQAPKSIISPPGNVFDNAPVVEMDDEPQLHWIDNPATRRKFWAWAREQGLSNVDVHAALGVEHVNDFDGDKAAAVEKINHWIDNRSILDEHGA
jgi:hypothetical protein